MIEGPFLAFPKNQAIVDGSTRKYAIRIEGEDATTLDGLLCVLGSFLSIGLLIVFLLISELVRQVQAYLSRSTSAPVPQVESSQDLPALLVIGIPFTLFSLWFSYICVRAYFDRATIERHGILLPGTLISCTVTGCVHYHYSLSLSPGMTVEGRVNTDLEDLEDRPPPKPGTPVLVYYLDPKRHRLL